MIIFRTCDSVNSVSKNLRPYGLSKIEIIKICFLSLCDAFKNLQCRIIVLGDNLSEESIQFFKKFNVEIHIGKYGNDASILESIKIANNAAKDEWIYFCEDDYLHTADSFTLIENFLNERFEILKQKVKLYNLSSFINLSKKDLFIFPPDYPDRYLPKYRKHSLILHSTNCHWRQVTNVTFTFLTHSATVKKHLALLKKSSHRANDRLLSRRLFRQFGFFSSAVCFSPLPGLSTHMHLTTATPLRNWESLVLDYKDKLHYFNS